MTETNIPGSPLVIPGPDSPCELWRTYFTRLKQEVGRENAKTLWLVTWGEVGSAYCTTNADFNRWLQRNNIDVSNAANRAVADVNQIGSNILGLGKNFTKVLSIGIPIASGIVLVILLLVLYRRMKGVAT